MLARHVSRFSPAFLICLAAVVASPVLADSPAAKSYTASVTFQVLPPAATPGQPAETHNVADTEEITRFINRQIYLIHSDELLDKILQSDELKKSTWLTQHADQPRKQLLACLEVSAIPNSDLFTITFTGTSQAESVRLVNAIGRVYLESLRTTNKMAQAQRLDDLTKIISKQEAQVNRLEEQLTDFRKAHDIDAINVRLQVAQSVLVQIEVDLVKAEVRAATALESADAIKKQVEAGTLTLPIQMQRSLENDSQLRTLEVAKLELEAENFTLQFPPDKSALAKYNLRHETAEKQLADRRQQLEADGRIQLQEQAEAEHTRAAADVKHLAVAREARKRDLMDMAFWSDQAQNRVNELKNQKETLSSLRQVYTQETLKYATDDSRIRKFGGDAVAAP